MTLRKEKVVKSEPRKYAFGSGRKGLRRANIKRRRSTVLVDTSDAWMESSISVGTITEPKYLGPCEPGTSVTLQGFVCCETDGVLVVNVSWRGKSYMGSLLDIEESGWAPTPPPNRLVADPRPMPDTSKLIAEEIEHTPAELNCLQTRSSKYNKGTSTPPPPAEKKNRKSKQFSLPQP